jgi:hypothetical protein
LVMRGAPNDLSSRTLRALGAERHAHRVGENIDAAQHAVASVDREFDFVGSHVDVLPAGHLHPEEWPSGRCEAFGPLSATFGARTLAGFTVITGGRRTDMGVASIIP